MEEKVTFQDFKDDIEEIFNEPIGRLKYFISVSLTCLIMNSFPIFFILGIPYILLQTAKRAKDLEWPRAFPIFIWIIYFASMVILCINGIDPSDEAFDIKEYTSFMQIVILMFVFFRLGAFLFFVLFSLKGKK